MNNLYDIYSILKDFADNHNMVNEFVYAKSSDELDNLEYDYRSIIIMPLEANISRQLNTPVYTLDFGVVILDKIDSDDDYASIISTEENVFIIGQLQDYLLQLDIDVDFDQVELYTAVGEDYNITSATTDFSATIARKPYTRGIDNA